MNTESKKPITQITSQDNDSAPITPDNSGSNQNRSGIMDNDLGKTDEIFEDQNVAEEGEVGNTGNNPNISGDETGFNETEAPRPVDDDNNDNDDEMGDSEEDESDEDLDSDGDDMDEAELDENALEDFNEEDDMDDEDEEDDDDALL